MQQPSAVRLRHPKLLGLATVSLAAMATVFCIGLHGALADNSRTAPRATQMEKYRLGPQDKVRVKVFAWRPAVGEVYEWKALNDVYSVGASGEISFPLIGDVAVGGLTLPEVSAVIGDQMKFDLGLNEAPQASVEIVEFRPFYITGSVQKPGEYSYRPGLTIIKAISLAGGMLRLNELDALRLDRDTITTAGERSVNVAELNALIARRARLEAEVNGATTVERPIAFSNVSLNDEADALLRGEQQIFDTRLELFKKKFDQINRNKDMLEQQLGEVRAHMKRVNNQVKLSADDLARFDDMLARRLTTNTRRAEYARLAMQAEDDRLRLQATEAGMEREINKSKLDLDELRDARVGQSMVELRAADARIDSLTRRVRTADQIVSDASAIRLASLGTAERKPTVSYRIIRNSEELAATETTLLMPGDTIKVVNGGGDHAPSRPASDVRDDTETSPSTAQSGTILTQDYGRPLR